MRGPFASWDIGLNIYYFANKEVINQWLIDKGLMEKGVFRIRRYGPWSVAYRYGPTPRVKDGDVVSYRSLHWGWPL